jgi:predicted NAD/FAD-binding protein
MSLPRLAIIGSGISGLGCAYFLHRKFDLTVFEAEGYIGGHTNTVTVKEDGIDLAIDTGFMVFNHNTYPLLCRLFDELGVETKTTEEPVQSSVLAIYSSDQPLQFSLPRCDE